MTVRLGTLTTGTLMAAIGVIALSGCSDGGGAVAMPDTSSPSDAPSAGASSGGELSVPADADEETRKQYVEQNALAACMRAKGFVYTPHVTRNDQTPLAEGEGRDYAAAKKYRQKYGFGIWAGAVYRDDPNVWGSRAYDDKDTSPNAAYVAALSAAQRKAYDEAFGRTTRNGKRVQAGCLKEADEKAYGPAKSRAEIDRQNAEDRQRSLDAQQALNGDPHLVSLAQQYASCLTGEGIGVTTTQPTSIGDMVKFQVSSQTPEGGVLSVDESEAVSKLTREIDLAGKDLTCGKAFRAAYFPKLAQHPFQDVTG
ncbi:hypothetical protein [Streptomyces sp. NPDC004284]|uniref:hypothetical protein n=1 Tax=Streptomyces sp. NPDC004284 TaxID=3364695 RepID=UPI003695C573